MSSNQYQMSDYIKIYYKYVDPTTLVNRVPKANKQNLIDSLTREGKINDYIIIDEQEEKDQILQAQAIKAKLSNNVAPIIKK